jgi:hypothetical protein
MAKISEILEIEKERTDVSSWNVIHLFKEGGFYRAYNWSAWLIVTFAYNDDVRKGTSDRKPLNVSRKKTKSGDSDFAFVGFPLKSLEKFIPYQTGFTPVNDTQIDVTIELPVLEVELSYESLGQMYEQWKESVPLSEEKPRRERDQGDEPPFASPKSITAVMAQVLSYPLESKTPMENMAFISMLKQQLAALF